MPPPGPRHGHAGVDEVGAARQEAQHAAGVVVVDRLLEDLAVDIDSGVGCDHDRAVGEQLDDLAAFSRDRRAT